MRPDRDQRHFRENPLLYALLLSGYLLTSTPGVTQTQNSLPAANSAIQDPYKLQVTSNLVVVRLVVRDAQGNPVKGLKKEDFKLFDKGKQQSITQFVAYPSAATHPDAPLASGSTGSGPSSGSPMNFMAFYFDDLNTSDADMGHAREAADHYLATNLRPQDRVAIFSTGKMLSDFTADAKQIHDALLKLHANPQALKLNHDCPELSDYQAQQIIQSPDSYRNNDAWTIALAEASQRCHTGLSVDAKNPGEKVATAQSDPPLVIMIRMLAESIVDQTEVQARNNLKSLERVVNYAAQMPGRRTIVLISPGFLTQNEQPQLNQVIDRALHAEVVIHSLDPRGLINLSREGDASRGYLPSVPGAAGALQNLDTTREVMATNVLAESAKGTGGQYFHHNNDLQVGFGEFGDPPEYYTLAFVPTNLKPDGKFHPLKVQLAEKHPDFSVQARQGYFARKGELETQVLTEAKTESKTESKTEAKTQEPTEAKTEVSAEAESDLAQASDAEVRVREQVRDAILSDAENQQLPVTLDATVASTNTQVRQLTLSSHLDTHTLHFHKAAGRNLNEILFAFAVFDRADKPVRMQQRWAKVDTPDAELRPILNSGLHMDVTFLLKPGIYRVRQVVMDSEENRLTARSCKVKIP